MDIGCVTVGENREFVTDAVSRSPYPIDFSVNECHLKNSGFSVQPSQMQGVPPGEKVKISLVFDTLRRTSTTVGDTTFDMTLVLGEDLGIFITVKVKLKLPELMFSSQHFDFGEVIIGQAKTMTLQLQNMNVVPCEFTLQEPTDLLVRRPSRLFRGKSMTSLQDEPLAKDALFRTMPSTGILPASAFVNVEIQFIPSENGGKSMQIPILVKYNPQPSFVTVYGKGVKLVVHFDPPYVKLPPVQPFSEPSQIEVNLVNPTSYPIEVFSYQFDGDLYVEYLNKTPPPVMEEVAFTPTNVSKFSVCVIINGPSMSGKTTTASVVSKYLNNAPIITLEDVWKDVPPESPGVDFTAAFFNRISQPDCTEGFVIDGLEFFKEPSETDGFVASCLKHKSFTEENYAKIFDPISHSVVTAVEQALRFILAALDGHYIFHVAVQSSPDILRQRAEQRKEVEAIRARTEEEKAKRRLVEMS
jgi:hydrocephalus-inducing protein